MKRTWAASSSATHATGCCTRSCAGPSSRTFYASRATSTFMLWPSATGEITDPMRYAIGDCVQDRYEVCELLGAGAEAEVYRATDINTFREVVLKIPHVKTAGDLVAFNRYRQEIDIASRLKHPGLQSVLSDRSDPFMVLEYIEGQSL